MNDYEKEKILEMRNQGIMPAEISKITGISINTIKSYFKRHKTPLPSSSKCPVCGKTIIKTNGKKNKRYCNDFCRMSYWNAHQEKVNKKAYYRLICQECGKEFLSYGNRNRKYCSRDCYKRSFKHL